MSRMTAIHDGEGVAYEKMLPPALERLEGRDPAAIAEAAGLIWRAQDGVLELSHLGRTYEIHWPDWTMRPHGGDWFHLVTLHYLDIADGAPLEGLAGAFRDLKDGMIRGSGLDRSCEIEMKRFLRGKEPGKVRQILDRLGAVYYDDLGDLNARFEFYPRVIYYLKIWWADDEFEASGRIFTDPSAEHYLSIEDSVTAVSVFIERLRAAERGEF